MVLLPSSWSKPAKFLPNRGKPSSFVSCRTVRSQTVRRPADPEPEETTRLTVTRSKEADYIEEAVRWRIFHQTVREAREAFADVSNDELQKMIDAAVEDVRAKRYREACQTALTLLILDTNILISGLLSALGAPAEILLAWERKVFTLVACEALITELRDVAGRQFFRARLRASAAELLAAGLRDISFFCRDLPSSPIAPDPKDSYLLALAEASEAGFLVTGDKELLSLKRPKSTRIISPAAMIELLKEAEER